MKRTLLTTAVPIAVMALVCVSGCGQADDTTASPTVASTTSSMPSASPTPTPAPSTPSPTPSPTPTQPDDPDRPADAMSIGESTVVDGIEVTVKKFQKVKPKDPLDGFTYYGAKMSFKNMTDGPKEVVADAQVRLENIYVATVNPLPMLDIKEGEGVPFGAFRPGTTVEGWVVWAVPDSSDILKSFGVYYRDMVGNEVVWWNNIKKA
jgi:hypothetical protein